MQSMGRVGSTLDNAAAESFHSVLKVEYVHRQTFTTRTEARLQIASWTAEFYSARRRHSAASGKPSAEFERIIQEARTQSGQEDWAASPTSLRNQGLTPTPFSPALRADASVTAGAGHAAGRRSRRPTEGGTAELILQLRFFICPGHRAF
ncbi:integrase core domain-containing protein [Streptomyces sp. NPDC091217]|uniref:integrase core domain-containing protein n=1 Tax=Streptomyces sp. NPDC091217 TaxID=3365975 RepID=UPI00382B3B54